VQSAQRGDMPPAQALQEISVTVQRATELANQMLALAKVEQLRHQGDVLVQDWAPLLRAVALDVGALVAAGHIDFDISTQTAPVRADAWALRELSRNLLHNAIKHCPAGGSLRVQLQADTLAGTATLSVADSGPGLLPEMQGRLFQPFATAGLQGGSGLGLAICLEIVQSLGGSIQLQNRLQGPTVLGLDAVVSLPLERTA
jgi:two-component system, OmpR family, sensor histidine kinase TctE